MAVWNVTGPVLALMLGASVTMACERPEGAARLEKDLLVWANAERDALGLPAFRMDSRLNAAALDHACDMATRGYFAHSREGGPKLKKRISRTGYKLRGGSENIAYTQQIVASSPAKIWRESPPHWNTVISRAYKDVGIAVAIGEGKVYWVMDFGKE